MNPSNNMTETADASSQLGASPNVPSTRAEMSPHVPPSPVMSPQSRMCKTNPNPDIAGKTDRLTPMQLAAARMLAKGCRVMPIAAALKINRRTLARWKQSEAFQKEIVRIHRDLSRPPVQPAPSRNVQPAEREFINLVYRQAMKAFLKQ